MKHLGKYSFMKGKAKDSISSSDGLFYLVFQLFVGLSLTFLFTFNAYKNTGIVTWLMSAAALYFGLGVLFPIMLLLDLFQPLKIKQKKAGRRSNTITVRRVNDN